MAMNDNENDSFGPALTDFMSGVAVVFLCLAVSYIVNDRKREVENTEKIIRFEGEVKAIDLKRNKFLNELKKILKIQDENKDINAQSKCVEVADEKYKITVRFKDRDNCGGLKFENKLFLISQISHQSEFVSVAKEICRFHKEDINSLKGRASFFDRIELLGHTDCNPFSPPKNSKIKRPEGYGYVECPQIKGQTDCGNLGLSALRARQVFLKVNDEMDSDMQSECLERLFKVSGRGSFEPVTKNKCNPNEDRRVEFVIYINPPKFAEK